MCKYLLINTLHACGHGDVLVSKFEFSHVHEIDFGCGLADASVRLRRQKKEQFVQCAGGKDLVFEPWGSQIKFLRFVVHIGLTFELDQAEQHYLNIRLPRLCKLASQAHMFHFVTNGRLRDSLPYILGKIHSRICLYGLLKLPKVTLKICWCGGVYMMGGRMWYMLVGRR